LITPVIVKVRPGYIDDLVAELSEYEFSVVRGLLDRIMPIEVPLGPLPMRVIRVFDMIAMPLPREVIFSLAEDNRVERIYSDELKFALRYPTVPQEGVYQTVHRLLRKPITFTSTYWTKQLVGGHVANSKGFTGKDVTVVVLDTGASPFHEQLSGIVKTSSVFAFQHLDTNGHGTWCCSCIAGRRSYDEWLSREVGRAVVCEGIAPDVDLYSIKCLGYVIGVGSDSDVIEGLSSALQLRADVVSMSLGGAVQVEDPTEDPYYEVMKKVTASGAIPCVAAGNEGPGEGTIASPGWLEDVLTVGAYDPITGEVASYSSRGPTRDGRIKPDVIAPGGGHPDHGIDSAVVNLLDKAGDAALNRYSPIQGTSMATPHVSGIIACMKQAHRQLLGRELTLEEVKRMMEQLADHEKNNEAGWGLISWQKYEEWLSTEYGVVL